MSLYRSEFVEAFVLFAEVSEAVEARGFAPPVELYAGSAIATGDFDVVTGRQDIFEQVLGARGFVRPAGPGHTFTGWIHPKLRLGFEVVDTTLLDGKAERDRVRLIDVVTGNVSR